MKKFASILTVAMLLVSMLLCGISANAAPTSTAIDAEQKGSVTLHKYDSKTTTSGDNGVTSGKPVKDAGFSFYQILTYDASGYKLTELAKAAVNAYNSNATETEKLDLDKVIDSIVVTKGDDAAAGDDGYASYGTTTDLENLVAVFQTYINSNNVASAENVTTDNNGSATASNLNLGVYLVVETKVPNGFIATTASFLVSVPYWQNNEDGWNYSVNAYPKDEPYNGTVDKQIVNNDGKTDADSLAVGDTVTYNVEGLVPNYGKSYRDTTVNLTQDRTIVTQEVYDVLPFVFEDTLSNGLTYAEDLSIKVAGSPVRELTPDIDATYADGKVTWSGTGDYYVNFDSAISKLKVIVKWDSLDNYQGNKITFSYNAVINDKAVVATGNSNTAKISVANNPSTFYGDYSNTNTDEYTSSTDTSTVYTYQLNLTKTFNSQSVADAEVDATKVTFEIANGKEEGSKVYSFLKTGDGEYTLWEGKIREESGKNYAVVDEIDENGNKTGNTVYATGVANTSELTTVLAVGVNGNLNVKGLDNKTYYVTELTTVEGYSVLAQTVAIQVNDVQTTTTTTEYHPFIAYDAEDFNADVTYYTLNETEYIEISAADFRSYVSTANDIKVVYYAETKTTTGNASSDVTAEVVDGQILKFESAEGAKSGIIPIVVNNSKNQFNLPLTGGLGLWMFTIAGGIVMAVAIIFFSYLRKRKRVSEK